MFMAYDVLEADGADSRHLRNESGEPHSRESAQQSDVLISPRVNAASWEQLALMREQSRDRGVEGLMIKHLIRPIVSAAPRRRGQLVEMEDRSVRGRRGAGLCAAWPRPARKPVFGLHVRGVGGGNWESERALVPFTKAYSGLTDEEIRKVDAAIRRTTIEKFGPVRSVTPTMVFEIGFEGIQRSPRHKSGIAVRFPRMLRWRQDKPVDEADTLSTLQAILAAATRAETRTELP